MLFGGKENLVLKFTNKIKIILGGLALCLGVIALIPSTLSNLLTIKTSFSPLQTLDYNLYGTFGCFNCLGGFRTQELTFIYPAEILENETLVASLVVDPILPAPGLAARLSGPNFEIKPAELQKVPLTRDGKTKLSWLMQPKKTGQHHLLLDISQLVRQRGGFLSYFAAHEIEGPNANRLLESTADAVIDLPIRVLTIWGISDRNFFLLRGLIGLIAFILATPLAYMILRRAFGGASIQNNEEDRSV